MKSAITVTKLKQILLDSRFIFVVWSLATIYAIVAKMGVGHHNNFLIFRGVAEHLFCSLPLYGTYPLEYLDVNLYGPTFGLVMAPFAFIPTWIAMPAWVVAISMSLYWAVRSLPIEVRLTSLVLLLSVNDFYGACLMQQFNIAVVALLIWTFVMIERGREGWAALFIVVGTLVKIYGVVGLGLFFFVRRKWRFVGYMALWSAVALLLPLLFVSPEYLWAQYVGWGETILQKNGENMFCGYTNISILGAIRKISGSSTYSDLLVLVPAMLVFAVSYFRVEQYKKVGFRLVMLASLLLSVVLFSTGSETSGYVTASVGAGIWWVTLQRRGWVEWTLLGLVVVASYCYPIFPKAVYDGLIVPYALKAVPYFFIWAHCIQRMWREQFSDLNIGQYPPQTAKINKSCKFKPFLRK